MTIINKKQLIIQGAGRFEIFGYQPDNVSKNKWGYLYIIGGINKLILSSNPNFYLLNSIASILKKEYYANYYENPGSALENALRKVNGIISSSEYRNDLEMLIIAIQDNRIIFTKIGETKILLIRNNKIFDLNQISKNYQELNKNTLFKNIIRGKIQEKDRLVITTKKARNLLKNEFFIARLIKRSFSQIEDFVKRNMDNLKKEPGIAILQITIEKFTDANYKKNVINKSISIDKNYKETNSAFSEGIDYSQLDNFYNKVSNLKINYKYNFYKNLLKTVFNFKKFFKIKSLFTNESDIYNNSNKTLKILSATFFILINFSKKLTRNTINNIIQIKQAFIEKKIFKSELYSKPKKLPFLNTKYKITIPIIVFIIIIILSIFIFSGNDKKTQIYDNNDIINSSLGESIKQIADTKNFPFTIKKIVIAENPIIENETNNKVIIGYSSEQVYKINDYSNPELLFTNSSISKPFDLVINLNRENIVFISKSDDINNKKILIYNINNNSFNTEEIKLPINSPILDAKSFNNSLYILGENNIIKYSFKNGSFSDAHKWIQTSSNQEKLINPLSMAIDGSIFVLDNLGNISEFLKGEKIDEIANLGLVSKDSQIITSEDWNKIYFFDPLSSKIIIINKLTSEIEYNFKDPFLTGIKYITPQNNESSLFVLDDKGIYLINLDKIDSNF